MLKTRPEVIAMKRALILSLSLLLVLLAVGCGGGNSPDTPDTPDTAPDEPAALDTAALGALLDETSPADWTLAALRGEVQDSFPAASAICAEDSLATLRGLDWTAFTRPADWDSTGEACYALTRAGASLTLYSGSAAVLHAETADGAGWFTVTGEANQHLYAALRDWYDGAAAAARYDYGGTPLTRDELAFFAAYTASSRTEGSVTRATPISCFFTSTYSDVRDLDAVEFLRYCPSEGCVSNADGEEARLVAEALDRRGADGQLLTVDELPTPCHRYPRAYLDGILMDYAGVTVAEMRSDWTSALLYLPATDCFYTLTSDFAPGAFRPVYGERSGDTVRLWTPCAENRCLTLDQDGDLWRIRSHETSGAPLYSVAYLGYGETVDLLTCIEALGLDVPPTCFVSGGEYYLIVPRYEDMHLALYRNDMESGERTLVREEETCRPFVLVCNVSDIFPDATVVLTRGGETVAFSPYLSLRDGSLQCGARGANITLPT